MMNAENPLFLTIKKMSRKATQSITIMKQGTMVFQNIFPTCQLLAKGSLRKHEKQLSYRMVLKHGARLMAGR